MNILEEIKLNKKVDTLLKKSGFNIYGKNYYEIFNVPVNAYEDDIKLKVVQNLMALRSLSQSKEFAPLSEEEVNLIDKFKEKEQEILHILCNYENRRKYNEDNNIISPYKKTALEFLKQIRKFIGQFKDKDDVESAKRK